MTKTIFGAMPARSARQMTVITTVRASRRLVVVAMTTGAVLIKIGELARLTGVSARSLRYYEQQGLLHSTRSTGGQRHYPATEVARVEIIRRLFDAGLSSKVIARLLPCVDSGDGAVAEDAFTTMLGERERLTADIGRLVEARSVLDELIEINTSYRQRIGTG
ncbi:MerR family transcriptional regulator [Lentzea sp. NPDC058450]|uniref:MerR family transcriptional regulator n=1 Tax=Lentzea sp. NPDC058450 TaxID=3346505 RepID=UPI003651B5E8